MLRLVIGPAHSGKTQWLHERILQCVENGGHPVLIVPEQASFANEKALFALLGEGFCNAEVVSFTRLAELLLRKLGGGARPSPSEAAALLTMSVALDELSQELSVYRRHYLSRGFVEQMAAIAAEFENAGVTPERLAQFSLELPDGALREKSYELSLILDVYQAVLRQSYLTGPDLLTLAASRLSEQPLYEGEEIFLDDFGGFTAPELTLIEALLSQASAVTVPICSDVRHSKEPAFAYSNDTAERLIACAQRVGAEVQQIILPARQRFGSLAAMEGAVRSERISADALGDGAVTCFAAADPWEELTGAAAFIARCVREKGLRYRDAAVITRDMTRYRTLLEPAFALYDIPVFLDQRTDAKSGVLTAGLLAAVSLAAGERGDPLLLAKSPLMGLDAETAGELENYCFTWQISAAGWNRPFENHPDGMLDRMDDSQAQRLARIEAARRTVNAPIRRLSEAMKQRNGAAFAKGVWVFLTEIGAEQRLEQFAEGLASAERDGFLAEQTLVWEQLMEILDLFARLPESVQMAPSRAAELFELAVGTIRVATPPQTLDQVAVGTANRMRAESPKLVLLLGVVEGEFPSAAAPGGLLSDAERRRMAQAGIPLLSDGERSAAAERMYCYRAVTAPSELLWVSYPRSGAAGETLLPSQLFRWANAFSPHKTEETMCEVQSLASAEMTLAARAGEQNIQTASLCALCRLHGREGTVLRLERIAARPSHRLTDRSAAGRLFGSRMRLSPSRLEQYYNCPFSYFAKSGLNLRPRRKAELSALEAGTLIHRVLEQMVSKYGGKGLHGVGETQLRAEVETITMEYLSERVTSIDALPRRLLHGFRRVADSLCELLRRLGEEFSQSTFEPIAFELPIKQDGAVTPLTLVTADGVQISVEGTVDRVDVAEVDGKRYVRVVDYKSGGKNFLLSDIFYGLNMQMLIYLFSIWQNGRGMYRDLLPAGILYAPAQTNYLSVSRGDDGGAARAAARYRMNGLLLDDPAVLQAMEADGKGIYIPIKNGKAAADTLASLAEMGRIKALVERRVTRMAELLLDGAIEAEPMQRAGHRACSFCDYRGVCGFEEGDAVRTAEKIEREALLEEVPDDGE